MIAINSYTNLLRKTLRHICSLPSEAAFRLYSSIPDGRPLKAKSMDHHGGDPISNAPKIIEENGFFVSQIDSVGDGSTGRMWAEGVDLFSRLKQRADHPHNSKMHTITARNKDLNDADSIFYWGLSDRILDIVEAYLGQDVAYDGFSAYYSRRDGREAGPRLWHRDREDTRMIKIAVYFSDVDLYSGPYEIVHPRYRSSLGKNRFKNMTDCEIRSTIGIGNDEPFAQACLGPAGTIVISDTALNYHRGRPPLERDRCAIFYSYFSRSPRYPFLCERSAYSRKQLKSLAEVLPEKKRRAVLWQQELPLTKKLIPKNRVIV